LGAISFITSPPYPASGAAQLGAAPPDPALPEVVALRLALVVVAAEEAVLPPAPPPPVLTAELVAPPSPSKLDRK
jgi:hypothetical protein